MSSLGEGCIIILSFDMPFSSVLENTKFVLSLVMNRNFAFAFFHLAL